MIDRLRHVSTDAGFPSAHHCAFDADIADAAACRSLVTDCIATLGRLDCLVNNAGIQAETPGDGFDPQTYARIIAIDLTAAALLSEQAIAHFLSRPGGGSIINTTSVHEIIPKPGYLAYSIAKGGLGSLTRTLALEFAARGVRVNAVGPGAVTTDMNAAWTDDPAKRRGVESHIPMGFAARAEDIAPVFTFLASEDARYITGQTLFACGGLTLYGEFAKNWSS
jgi:glucose 1-dehydrogenase